MSTLPQFLGGNAKSIQRGVITISGGASTATATLSPSVNTAKTTTNYLGHAVNSSVTTQTDANVYIVLENATTVRAYRLNNVGSVEVSWEIREEY